MNRGKQLFFVFVVAAALPASARAQTGIQYDKIEIKTDKVAPNLYMLSGSEGVDPGHPDGAGGRIGVLAGPDGIFMVDSQYLQIGDQVRFRMNGETVELIPVRAAHTGGDTMVRFVNADVIMIGDFYRNFGYPFIDTANGGSLKGALEGLELTMKIAGPNTRLIPGHGTYINRTDIIPYRDMILGVQAKVQQLIAQGKTLQDVLAAKVTSPYDAKVPGGLLPAGAAGTSADRFVSMVYSQL